MHRNQQLGDEHYQGGLHDSLQKHSPVQGYKDHTSYWKVFHSTVRRGRHFVSKRSYRKCYWEPSTRILFQLLSRAKENRRSPAYSKSKTYKRPNREPFLQNGDPGICIPGDYTRRLACVSGPQGRLFSCAYPQRSQEIPSLLHRKHMLPIQGSPFWSDHFSESVYKDTGPNYGVSPSPRNTSIPLSGRPTVDCGVQTDAPMPHKTGLTGSFSEGLHHKHKEVISSPISGHEFLGGSDSIQQEHYMSPPGKGTQTSITGSLFSPGKALHGQKMAGPSRCDCLSPPHGAHGSSTNATYSNVPSSSLESQETGIRSFNPNQPNSVLSPPMVDKPGSPTIRFTPIPSRTSDCAHDRCLLSRLGRCSGGRKEGGGAIIDRSGNMVASRTGMAHQYAGVDGSIPIPPALSEQGPEQNSVDQVGQHDDLCLYKQDGRNQVMATLQSDNRIVELVSNQHGDNPGSTCPGSGQHSGGLSITPASGSEGMEPSQQDSILPLQEMG